ncbi:hypothetical protein ARMSODRAFT_952481 [Armillaria solidipes]|uniref:Methyltransferase domain-containing protein n=1 Tax=Armillaria solidipes TaxID=1076256 RepID=A0A2H3BR99_9AGAR|nr:hypothetical protein ARMSODRAFT_952481 [Armillaria solidipes]
MNSKLESLSARHPRYMILFITLSFVVVLLYVNFSPDSPFSGSNVYAWGARPPPYDYAARAHMNDIYCQGAVQEHGFQVVPHAPPSPPSRGYEAFQGHPPHPDHQGRPWGYGPPPPGPWGPPPPPPFGWMHHGEHGGPEGKHPPHPPPFWGPPPPPPTGDEQSYGPPPPPPHHWWAPPPPPSGGDQSYGMHHPPPHSYWGPPPPPPHEFHRHGDSRPPPPRFWGPPPPPGHQHGYRPTSQDGGEHHPHGPPPHYPPRLSKHDKHNNKHGKPCPEGEADIKTHRPRPHPPVDVAIEISEKHYQDYVEHRKDFANEAIPLWKSFAPAFRCPHHLQLLGEPEDNGKWVCGFEHIAPKEQCVVYSIGSDGSSFETTVKDRSTGCTVFGYVDKAENTDAVTEDEETIATEESDVPATVPTNPLDDLLETNGHKFIDILKFNINSESDFAILDAFLDEYDFPQLASRAPYPPPRRASPPPKRAPVLPFGQLLLSVAVSSDDDKSELSISDFGTWFEKLERMGLRPFFAAPRPSNSRNAVDYSFINIRGEHELLSAVAPPPPPHFPPAP